MELNFEEVLNQSTAGSGEDFLRGLHVYAALWTHHRKAGALKDVSDMACHKLVGACSNLC